MGALTLFGLFITLLLGVKGSIDRDTDGYDFEAKFTILQAQMAYDYIWTYRTEDVLRFKSAAQGLAYHLTCSQPDRDLLGDILGMTVPIEDAVSSIFTHYIIIVLVGFL